MTTSPDGEFKPLESALLIALCFAVIALVIHDSASAETRFGEAHVIERMYEPASGDPTEPYFLLIELASGDRVAAQTTLEVYRIAEPGKVVTYAKRVGRLTGIAWGYSVPFP